MTRTTASTAAEAGDQFIFDCGAGLLRQLLTGRGRRLPPHGQVFINHLHGRPHDDLSHIYCFGRRPTAKTPLYVWGSKPTGSRVPPTQASSTTTAPATSCACLRQAIAVALGKLQLPSTCYSNYVPAYPKSTVGLPRDPVPDCGDAPNDAYAIVPVELDFEQIGGVALRQRRHGGESHPLPVIHLPEGLPWATSSEWTHAGGQDA
jgi:hypothetical protein